MYEVKLVMGVKSSGACVSLEWRMVDVQMADHRLMSSDVMAVLSAAGFGLAMVKFVDSSIMVRMRSAGVIDTVVAM